MLKKTFRKLDDWIMEENARAAQEGFAKIQETTILVIGQSALLEAKLNIDINATMDVDTHNELTHKVATKLNELLNEIGKTLAPLGPEAWMPAETKYLDLYNGTYIAAKIAEPVFIMISKAKKAPAKNKQLLAEYLASDDCDDRIYELAEKYEIDLEKIL